MTASFEIVYLNPKHVKFARKGDTLSMSMSNGIHYPRVVLRSCFPVSDENVLLSVRNVGDEEQGEIGIIKSWKELEPESRRAVADELGLHYFVPQIKRVHRIRDEFGFLYWTVETDKGTKEFVMRNNVIRCAREVSQGHWLLIDVNQARYEITNIGALDRKSQRLTSRYLYL